MFPTCLQSDHSVHKFAFIYAISHYTLCGVPSEISSDTFCSVLFFLSILFCSVDNRSLMQSSLPTPPPVLLLIGLIPSNSLDQTCWRDVPGSARATARQSFNRCARHPDLQARTLLSFSSYSLVLTHSVKHFVLRTVRPTASDHHDGWWCVPADARANGPRENSRSAAIGQKRCGGNGKVGAFVILSKI